MSDAYSIQSKDRDVGGALVWADSRGKAKAIACKMAWMSELDWTDLECRREKTIDDERPDGYCACDEPTPDDCRLMRGLKWAEIDGSAGVCLACDLPEWLGIPESRLGEGGICAECRWGQVGNIKNAANNTKGGE